MTTAQTVFYRDRPGLARPTAQPRVGQLSREAVSVCGFGSAEDAVTAASVAFHALRQYLAGRALAAPGLVVDAAGVTVRRAPDEANPFCFELQFPMRLVAATAIRAAHAINDALGRWRTQRTEDVDDTGQSAAAEQRDDVDEDSIQSFPASDPPGWISMWLGTPTNAKPLSEVV
jgi:hypothetical protein